VERACIGTESAVLQAYQLRGCAPSALAAGLNVVLRACVRSRVNRTLV